MVCPFDFNSTFAYKLSAPIAVLGRFKTSLSSCQVFVGLMFSIRLFTSLSGLVDLGQLPVCGFQGLE